MLEGCHSSLVRKIYDAGLDNILLIALVHCMRPHFDAVQSKDYDAGGKYIRKWVPELAAVPAEHIHAPWRMTAEEQESCGVRLPEHYPLPLSGTRYYDAP